MPNDADIPASLYRTPNGQSADCPRDTLRTRLFWGHFHYFVLRIVHVTLCGISTDSPSINRDERESGFPIQKIIAPDVLLLGEHAKHPEGQVGDAAEQVEWESGDNLDADEDGVSKRI